MKLHLSKHFQNTVKLAPDMLQDEAVTWVIRSGKPKLLPEKPRQVRTRSITVLQLVELAMVMVNKWQLHYWKFQEVILETKHKNKKYCVLKGMSKVLHDSCVDIKQSMHLLLRSYFHSLQSHSVYIV